MVTVIEAKLPDVVALCRRYRVRQLRVFGSAVSGQFDPKTSDFDFLVEFEPMPPVAYADAYFGLKEGLEELFGRPVDLVTAESVVNPYLGASIAARSETVYAA
jgi:predicted nucleotidyltransferase